MRYPEPQQMDIHPGLQPPPPPPHHKNCLQALLDTLRVPPRRSGHSEPVEFPREIEEPPHILRESIEASESEADRWEPGSLYIRP